MVIFSPLPIFPKMFARAKNIAWPGLSGTVFLYTPELECPNYVR